MKKKILIAMTVSMLFATSYTHDGPVLRLGSNKAKGAGGSGGVAKTRPNLKNWENNDFQYGKNKPYKTKAAAQKAARKYLRQAIQEELKWAPVHYQQYGFQTLDLDDVRKIYSKEIENYDRLKKPYKTWEEWYKASSAGEAPTKQPEKANNQRTNFSVEDVQKIDEPAAPII